MIPESQAELVLKTLDAHKALDITSINVSNLTNITDYMIICTATSTRHAQALADKITRQMKEHNIRPLSVEGVENNDNWILVDFGDVVTHIMLCEAREFYNLEKLWNITTLTREKHTDEH